MWRKVFLLYAHSVARRGFTDAKLSQTTTENGIFNFSFSQLNNQFPRTCYIYFDSSHRDESKYTSVILKFGERELVKFGHYFFLFRCWLTDTKFNVRNHYNAKSALPRTNWHVAFYFGISAKSWIFQFHNWRDHSTPQEWLCKYG